jgi:hypothetical protein
MWRTGLVNALGVSAARGRDIQTAESLIAGTDAFAEARGIRPARDAAASLSVVREGSRRLALIGVVVNETLAGRRGVGSDIAAHSPQSRRHAPIS